MNIDIIYQPSGVGGTHSLTSMPVKSKMTARGPQNGRWSLERCLTPRFLGPPVNFPSTPSMRKGRDGREKKNGKETEEKIE